jgi:hypothetical protein
MKETDLEFRFKTIFQAYSGSKDFINRQAIEFFAVALAEAVVSPVDKQ